MKHTKYKDWLSELTSGDEGVIQVRMMSSGDSLSVGRSPAYGVYLADEESDDEIYDRNMAAAMSSLGGDNSTTAPIEFYVGKAPLFGHVVRRAHGEALSPRYGSNAKVVGWSPSLKGADRIAYKKALKAGSKLAGRMDAMAVDQTSQDFSRYSESSHLGLENRVWNFEKRVEST